MSTSINRGRICASSVRSDRLVFLNKKYRKTFSYSSTCSSSKYHCCQNSNAWNPSGFISNQQNKSWTLEHIMFRYICSNALWGRIKHTLLYACNATPLLLPLGHRAVGSHSVTGSHRVVSSRRVVGSHQQNNAQESKHNGNNNNNNNNNKQRRKTAPLGFAFLFFAFRLASLSARRARFGAVYHFIVATRWKGVESRRCSSGSGSYSAAATGTASATASAEPWCIWLR